MTTGRLNRGHVYRSVVGPEEAGVPVGEFLARSRPHSTLDEWIERVRAGLVEVDGRTARAGAALRAGEEVAWHRPPWVEPGAPRRFDRLLEDEFVLVVAKPAGLPTLPGAGFLENTLLAAVQEDVPAAAPVHRLGRWTSGIVVFGKTAAARAELSRAWNEPDVVKRYRLLAAGDPELDRFDVDVPIGPVPYPPLGTLHAASADGRPARTQVAVIERRGAEFLADATLETGRPHQIRIHLAAAGHPLVGDPLFGPGGGPIPGGTALPGDPGYLLHAAEVRCPHPVEDREVAVRCPPTGPLRRNPIPAPDLDLRLRPARETDLEAVLDIVRAENEFVTGLVESFGEAYVVATLGEMGGEIVGAAGVEIHGACGLLRSVVTAPGVRGTGLGRRLVEDRITWARRAGLESLTLFTVSAADFFAHLGFREVPRANVPSPIHSSAEFAHGDCARARAFTLPLD